MIPVSAPRIDINECKNEIEKSFLEQLQVRAEKNDWHVFCHPDDDKIILYVDLGDSDPKYKSVLQTLRIDFDGTSVWFGKDFTGQFAGDLNLELPNVFMVTNKPLEYLVDSAATWLENQLKRPAERHEWDSPVDERGRLPRQWFFSDTHEPINFIRICPTTPPDRIVPVKLKNLCIPVT